MVGTDKVGPPTGEGADCCAGGVTVTGKLAICGTGGVCCVGGGLAGVGAN